MMWSADLFPLAGKEKAVGFSQSILSLCVCYDIYDWGRSFLKPKQKNISAKNWYRRSM